MCGRSEPQYGLGPNFRTCLVSAESGRIVENRLRSLSCQIIQAIFLERNLR
ncbi:DNA methyltransferase [Lacticaseibacillus rhamnosus]|nr:DNA methyltransferase [Lacticaseibacillus rhamnosus]PCL21870.1 DNA methyltransferase [Lacticaseibacillus paracasei]PCL32649.1 DNA methyltransferase [Lacticaseibacillus paracasei]